MINASDSLLSQFSYQFSQLSLIFSFALKHPIFPAFEHHFFRYTLCQKSIQASLCQTLYSTLLHSILLSPSIQKKIAFRYTLSIVTTPNVISTLQSCFCFSIIGAPLFHTFCQIITADSVTISPSLFARQISNLSSLLLHYIVLLSSLRFQVYFIYIFLLSISLLQNGHFNIQIRISPSQSHYCCKKFVSYFHLDLEMAPGTSTRSNGPVPNAQDNTPAGPLFHPRPRLRRLDQLLLRPPAICSLHQGRRMRKRTLD